MWPEVGPLSSITEKSAHLPCHAAETGASPLLSSARSSQWMECSQAVLKACCSVR